MPLIIVLGLLWSAYIFVTLRTVSRIVGQSLDPEVAPITRGWGIWPRYGDEFELANFGCLFTLLLGLVGIVVIYFLLDIDRLLLTLSSHALLAYLLAGGVFLGILLAIAYIKSRINFQILSKRTPKGNCFVLYHRPMVVQESYIFTLAFGTEEVIGGEQPPIKEDKQDANLEEEVPRPASTRLRGIFYSLHPKAKGNLRIEPVAPSFKVTPEFREIRVPIKEESSKAKFVVIPTQPGKQAFVFDLSHKGVQVGFFETVIPVYSVATERIYKLIQIITPLTTAITLALQVLEYLKK